MLKNGRDYRWDTGNGLSIKWNGQWKKIEVPGYSPIELLGAGANGVTYKAFHQVTNRFDVIKVWMPGRENYEKRFMNEVQKVSALHSNAIMSVYDGKVLPDGFCVAVYEYIPGKTLKEWLDTNPTVQDRLNVCREILQAVHYYQSKGILHGDLHEGNILVSPDLHPTLIDFGISAFSQEGQTKDRELYFIATLVSILLKSCKAYDEEHFAFRTEKNPRPHVESIPGVLTTFSFEPISMTETMQQYTELMELMEHITKLDLESIVTYAGFASQSFYLDIRQFIRYTMDHYINVNLRHRFVSVMDENIYCEAFPENCCESCQIEKIQMSSLMAYCVLTKLAHPPLINIIDENLLHIEGNDRMQKIVVYNKVIDALNIWAANAQAQDFFEVTPELQMVTGESSYELYEMVRQTLFQSLYRFFCGDEMNLSYWLSTKIREFQRRGEYPEKLKNAIMLKE